MMRLLYRLHGILAMREIRAGRMTGAGPALRLVRLALDIGERRR